MRIVRIVAEHREGGSRLPDYKFYLVCGLDDKNKVALGEWVGYLKNESVYYPFILQNETCFYGGDEPEYELINISSKNIVVGEVFTISNQPGSEEEWEAIYEVTHCHEY